MEDINPQLELIMQARENRGEMRCYYSDKNLASISLSLNIPGYPKSDILTELFFKDVLDNLNTFLQAHRVLLEKEKKINEIDSAGHIYISALNEITDCRKLKLLTEEYETNHPLGRIIDIDIFDKTGKPVSSGKKKKCFICSDKSAVECMREKTHSYIELREYIFKSIQEYIDNKDIEYVQAKISEIATRVLLYEVSLSPKPGLVDFYGSGSHTDMNYNTFLNSVSSLSQYWKGFAKSGILFNKQLSEALPEIRNQGIKAEKSMFLSTDNVNTHKGLIFVLGISIFVSSYLWKQKNKINNNLYINTIKKICKNIVTNEMGNHNNEPKTHGELVFEKYGMQGAGIRLEAQNGFPIVFNDVLPFLEKELTTDTYKNKDKFNKILSSALLIIISKLNDSNILYRKGLETLNELKLKAVNVLKQKYSYLEFCNYCKAENVSPGGSADILAVALFFFFMKNELNK